MNTDPSEATERSSPDQSAPAQAGAAAPSIVTGAWPDACFDATVAKYAAGQPLDAATQATYDEAVRALRCGRVNEAEKAFLALLQQRPDVPGVHANLGLVYRNLGRLDAAVAELEEAARMSPHRAGYHNQLGLTWRMLGRYDAARRAFETALQIDPTHAGALINLAILHALHLGDPARAAELYSRAAELLPEQAGMIRKWIAEMKNRQADAQAAGSRRAAAA